MKSTELDFLALVGPTACGKTRRAVELAQCLDGEIVSADSRQLYRGMDIGTGKDLEEYGTVPYHMIDIAPAGERYNLFQYVRDARKAIADIKSRGKLPIVCGGTGLYVETLLKGIELPEVPRNEALRHELAGESLEALTARLARMKRLHNNTDTDTVARALRAIEIETYYAEHPEAAEAVRSPRPAVAVTIGLEIDREERRERITARMRKRFDSQDMLGEVRRLLDAGLTPDDLIYYGLEYKYLTLHLIGQLSREEMEKKLEIEIHRFAKRQMTWFRGMERRGFKVKWLPYDMPADEFCSQVSDIIESYR